jgi:hypothetical protein
VFDVAGEVTALSVGILSEYFSNPYSDVCDRRLLLYPYPLSVLSTTSNKQNETALDVKDGSLRLKDLTISYLRMEGGKVFIRIKGLGDVRLINCTIKHSSLAVVDPLIHVTTTEGVPRVFIQSTAFDNINISKTSIIVVDKGVDIICEYISVINISISDYI